MLRSKSTSKRDDCVTPTLPHGRDCKRSPLEGHLLDFLDTFNIQLFLYEPTYRLRLNTLLDLFSEEEFATFEQTHSHRFTVN